MEALGYIFRGSQAEIEAQVRRAARNEGIPLREFVVRLSGELQLDGEAAQDPGDLVEGLRAQDALRREPRGKGLPVHPGVPGAGAKGEK